MTSLHTAYIVFIPIKSSFWISGVYYKRGLNLRLHGTHLCAQNPCCFAAAVALDTGKIIKNLVFSIKE